MNTWIGRIAYSLNLPRSDSSMVDEYNNKLVDNQYAKLGSDSSMVDEYSNCSSKSLNCSLSSDSSMVDEYSNDGTIPLKALMFRFLYGRWIPRISASLLRSGLCSDSSMVDEYLKERLVILKHCRVQIPLWSMNTQIQRRRSELCSRFRFLYGRWIQCGRLFSFGQFLKFRFLYGRWIPIFITTWA